MERGITARVDLKSKSLDRFHQDIYLECAQSYTVPINVHHDEVPNFSIKDRLHLEAPHRRQVKLEKRVYRVEECVISCPVPEVKYMLSAA